MNIIANETILLHRKQHWLVTGLSAGDKYFPGRTWVAAKRWIKSTKKWSGNDYLIANITDGKLDRAELTSLTPEDFK